MHRPLSRYVHVMGEVGLLIEDMDEPPPPPGFLAEAWEYGEASTIPRLMLLRARRIGDRHGGRRAAADGDARGPDVRDPAPSRPRGRRPGSAARSSRASSCSSSTPGCSLALNDPRGTLGTDTGGKLATLHVMDRGGELDPDVGYWARR